MSTNSDKRYVIGIDFGTGSVRALLVDAISGKELANSLFEYPRWSAGLYTIAESNQFRHHPLDYLEGLEFVVTDLIAQVPGAKDGVCAISIDTTGSTPCMTDKDGTPLALTKGFETNPNAMFILWKDHTAIEQAAEINQLVATWDVDYTKFSGKNYSSEWFWAKALHVLRSDQQVRTQAYYIVELCDWLPAILTGNTKPHEIKTSRCSAGHKAMWSEQWGGFPSQEFLSALDPLFHGFAERFSPTTYSCDQIAGTLCKEWAVRFGLGRDVVIGIGNTDAHAGAVGAGIKEGMLVQNLGTSTCNMIVMPPDKVGDMLIEGISGQVDSSIIPGMVGFEAGMSAFGDIYAWFASMILKPVGEIIGKTSLLDQETKNRVIAEISKNLLTELTEKAEQLEIKKGAVWATDWFNGRRNPYIDQTLKATIDGLTLSTDAYDIFYALVESTAFGIRAIVEHFIEHGVEIESIVATGGISAKSPFVVQMLSDMLNMPIAVSGSEQACALGSAMFAATIGGFYDRVEQAQEVFTQGIITNYAPNGERHDIYSERYERYKKYNKA